MSSTTNFVQSEFRYDEGKSPLALLAETCRNIGVDTTTSKLAKSSIDHVKPSTNSSSSSSSLSTSSSSSIESSSRKNNDSCRLSVSPLRNATPVTPTSRTSANSVNGSSTNINSNNNNSNISNNSTHNVIVSNASNHSSSSSSSTGSYIGNNNITTISASESNGCSFKPYEDHIISKKKCLDESRIRSTPQVHESDNKNRVHNNSKHYNVNSSNNNSSSSSESVSKTYESNCSIKRENVKSSSNHVSTIVSPSSSSSSSSTTSSASTTVITSTSSATSTSTAHVNRSSPSKGSNNCNGCLPPQHQPTTSTPHPMTVDNVAKYVPYPSLSPYLGLPPPTGYDPASVAAVAAAVAGHCHSPSMCRDPFCAGCRFNAAAAANVLGQVSACPAGCNQCSHVTSQMTSSMSHQIAALQANGYLPGNAFYPPHHPSPHHQHQHQHQHHPHHHPGNPPTPSSNNSPHGNSAAAVAAASNGKPNICSWMIGNTYCGKRFTSSEELHQHLRNHTSSDPTSVSALAFLGQYPHLDPMLTSPIAGLRRTAFDPVNRYHPYKSLTSNGSPLGTLTNGLSGAIHKPPPGSQINMHYPPYGPYTGRLGPPILP